MSDKAFASQADLVEKTVSFDKLSDRAYAYTAEGDPNTGVVIGDDAVMVIDTQATPVMAQDVIRRIREVTAKPIRYVTLTHYHAVRVLGASGYKPEHIIASRDTFDLIVERGEQDMKSEIERFPRLFRAVVYNKSAIVLHMLRQLVGDEAFFAGLRRFYQDSRFQNVAAVDFQVAMERETGRPLDRFFNRWIDSATLPRVRFSYRVDGSDVVLRLEQLGDLFDLPVTVTLQYADRETADVVVPVTDRVVELRVPLRGALRAADISRDDPPLAEVVRN